MSRKSSERRREFLQRAQLSGNRPILESDPSKRSRLRGAKYVWDPSKTYDRSTPRFRCPLCTERMPDVERVGHLMEFHSYAEPGAWTEDP